MARLRPDGPDRTAYYFFHIRPEDGARVAPETELLDFRASVPCPAWIAPHLGLAPRAPMIFARNLQRIAGRPVVLDELWLPKALFPGLGRARLGTETLSRRVRHRGCARRARRPRSRRERRVPRCGSGTAASQRA